MQFMALIFAAEGSDDVDLLTLIKQYEAFEENARQAGVLHSGNALEPISTATSLQVRNGEITTTDGPFAETKEQLGGYYLFECADLDDALFWAAQIPNARTGTVEVRPVMVFE